MIETSTCPSCGGVIEKGDRFCQECGRALSTTTSLPTKSLVEKLHSFRAELILLGAVVIYAVSVVCWTDRASLMHLANMPAAWFAKSTKPEAKVDSNAMPTVSTVGGASVKRSESADRSELQSLFSKSQTFPSVNVGTARGLTAKSTAAATAMPGLAAKNGSTVGTAPAPPAKKLIAERKLATPVAADSSTEATEQPASEIASDSAAEATDTKVGKAQKSIKTDTKAIAAVAEYNRLLADYFARKKSNSDSPDSTSEPPSYQEWIAGRKPYF